MTAGYIGDGRRAGNTDRERYTTHLAQMCAEGFLTEDEFRSRRDEALTAVMKDDLRALVRDLPEMPSLPERRYKTQVCGDDYPFSARRWIATAVIGLTLITLPGPLMSGYWGGWDHTPGDGALAAVLILLGVVTFVIGGITQAPDGTAPMRAHPKNRGY